MKKEIWKNVVDFEGLYEVSSLGRVRRLVDGTHYKKGILLPFILWNGYPWIGLYKNNHQYSNYIHRLVLTAFRGICPKGKEASHLDDVKVNCKLENLEWMTSSENKKLAFKNGRQSNAGKNHPFYGKQHSLESRKKMSESHKNLFKIRKEN